MTPLADSRNPDGLDVILRAAQKNEARTLAELFRMSAGGVADYIWQGLAAPGETLLDVGARRFAREDNGLSYRNCVVAEYDGKVVGMMLAYPIAAEHDQAEEEPQADPVLRPYTELEIPDSLYLACYAVLPDYRRQGVGSQLLETLRETAPWHELSRISALVPEENAGSLRLLRRYGFAEVDRRRIVPHPLIEVGGDVVLLAASV